MNFDKRGIVYDRTAALGKSNVFEAKHTRGEALFFESRHAADVSTFNNPTYSKQYFDVVTRRRTT